MSFVIADHDGEWVTLTTEMVLDPWNRHRNSCITYNTDMRCIMVFFIYLWTETQHYSLLTGGAVNFCYNKTQRRQYEGHNTSQGRHNDQDLKGSVSMVVKGCIVAWVLPLRFSLFSLPDYIHIHAFIMRCYASIEKRGVLQQEYSWPPILSSPHFPWVVNSIM